MTLPKRITNQLVWRILQNRLLSPLRPRLCHFEAHYIAGKTKRGQNRFSALVFGPIETAYLISKISFSQTSVFRNLGNILLHNIPEIISKTDPDIVILAANNTFSDFLISKNFFVLPQLNFVLDISDSLEHVLNRMDQSKRRLLHKIENRAYSYEFTNDVEKLKMFYDKMYSPHIISRHGKSAELVSFNECKRFLNKGGLLLSKLDDNYVSGALFVRNKDELYIPILAVNEPDKNLRKGVGLAPLYFLIQWGKKNGFKWIDYGSCQPFLKNGLFRYKKEWGMQLRSIKNKKSRFLAIKFCNFSSGTVDFLLENPFVFENKNQLEGLAVLLTNENLLKTYKVPGLSKLILLTLSSNLTELRLEQLHKLNLEHDHHKVPPSLAFLLEIASRKGCEAYALDF